MSRSRGSRRKTEKEGDDESPGVLLLPAVDHERGEGVGSGSRSMVSVGGFSSTSRRVVVSSKSSVKHNQALVFCTLSILFLMGLMIVASVVVVAYTLSEIQAVEDALLKYRDVTLRGHHTKHKTHCSSFRIVATLGGLEHPYCLRSFYPRGIGPTYELYSSSRRTAVVPLLKNYMHFFWLFFWAG